MLKDTPVHIMIIAVLLMLGILLDEVAQYSNKRVKNAAAEANMLEIIKPTIIPNFPEATVDVGVCYYDTKTTTKTCNVNVTTCGECLIPLKCSHNFISKQTTCTLVNGVM